MVTNGDLLAKVKVVPNEQALNTAKGRLSNPLILLKNAEVEFNRNQSLFDKEIISKRDFDNAKLTYDQAKQNGDSVGGIFEVFATGLPYGLGSYSQWDRKLQSKITSLLMSVNALKSI